MKWEDLLRLVGHEPVFRSALLLAGEVSVAQVRLQLSRWVNAGRLVQLRRGLYALAPVWRKVEPHPFLVANALHRGSYVSLQAALAYYSLIPEHVPVVTSVGPGQPERVENGLGRYELQHLGPALRWGYQHLDVAAGQFAAVAMPEKALLDLIYLTPGGSSPTYLRELRLQNLDVLASTALAAMAARSGKPKLRQAAQTVQTMIQEELGVVW